MGSVECLESTLKSTTQQGRRIDRSMTIELSQCEALRLKERRTNIRMPSASAFQFSTIFLSSSVAISKYIEKIGPELSTKSEAPCGPSFWVDWGGYWSSPIWADGAGKNDGNRAVGK